MSKEKEKCQKYVDRYLNKNNHFAKGQYSQPALTALKIALPAQMNKFWCYFNHQ
jgi:hypothetical protein